MAGTILFLYGADTYRSRMTLQAIKQRYIDASLGDTNLAALDGATLTFAEFVRQVTAFPFLAKTRLVIVRDLLLTGKKEGQEAILAYLPKIPESTVVCFIESGLPDQRTALFKRLAKEKLAQEFAPLEGSALRAWLRRAVSEREFSLKPDAEQFLVEVVGSDLWRMTNELDKLAAYATSQPPAKSNRIGIETIRDLVYREDDADVFVLVAAMARGDTGTALAALKTLLCKGEAELYIFSMIVWQFRTLIAAAEAFASGSRNHFDLARAAGIAPFVAQKLLPLLPKLTLPELVNRYDRLLTYDVAMKTGDLEPAQALEILVVELCGGRLQKVT